MWLVKCLICLIGQFGKCERLTCLYEGPSYQINQSYCKLFVSVGLEWASSDFGYVLILSKQHLLKEACPYFLVLIRLMKKGDRKLGELNLTIIQKQQVQLSVCTQVYCSHDLWANTVLSDAKSSRDI